VKVGGAEAVGWADTGVGGVGLRLARLLEAGLWPREPTPTGFAWPGHLELTTLCHLRTSDQQVTCWPVV